ncbi:uncharacterized protein LOC118647441 [Monomorium pharaonis]|uniref:uncharacterized protein LOC118647441 n=1 Tax=Monomorium pharaonis TaxID=307658 RepID=UPI001747011D|nr:uncharacterized protein LOC118647441 [Monomorium pharaonis]
MCDCPLSVIIADLLILTVATYINPPLDLIRQFLLDPMHSVYLGVMKKLFEYWLNGNVKTVRISNNAKKQLSVLLIQLQRQIPCELQRTTRSLSEINKFKSTEFQFILLYAGPIIFKKVLPKNIYKHFLLLHIGCRLLSSREFAVQKNKHAKYLLTKFVEIAPSLYGEQCLIGNMYSLIHLADDIEYMNCPISYITTYSFENMLGKLKKLLHHGKKPLEQICRRWNELAINIKQPTIPPTIQILRKLRSDHVGNIPVVKIQLKNTILTNKSPNNTVLLNNNKILEINSIYISVNENIQSIKITGIILKKNEPLYKSMQC